VKNEKFAGVGGGVIGKPHPR